MSQSSLSVFDPQANKVTNTYGGYDSNEKGIVQYPVPKLPFYNLQREFAGPQSESNNASRWNTFRNPILDPVTRHYRRFVQDPSRTEDVAENSLGDVFSTESKGTKPEPKPMSCRSCITKPNLVEPKLSQKPIDPVHFRPDLFDTRFEKYYLRNIINEDPYRQFLSDCTKDYPHLNCSEYRQSYSGNPVVVATSGKIVGLGRPTDLTETCDWRRNQTRKLRDVIFSDEKGLIDSNLDYNDPKRYNPWPRLRMSYAQMIESNYRPRPHSGVEYSVTTLLPAVSPRSKLWIV